MEKELKAIVEGVSVASATGIVVCLDYASAERYCKKFWSALKQRYEGVVTPNDLSIAIPNRNTDPNNKGIMQYETHLRFISWNALLNKGVNIRSYNPDFIILDKATRRILNASYLLWNDINYVNRKREIKTGVK